MAIAYQALQGIHNLTALIALLLTLIAGGLLLSTASTTTTARLLRWTVLSVSIQFVLGVVLIVVALLAYGVGYAATFWLHYALGIVSVGVVSALAARARRTVERSGSDAARRYGGLLIATVVLLAITYYIGFSQYVLPV
jgi:bacteriorhodopsin